MNTNAHALSENLESLRRGLAEWTVERHASKNGSLETKYGNTWRRDWKNDVELRFRYLAQAVAVENPAVFAWVSSWMRSAFAARQLDPEDLRQSLVSMKEVCASELPPDVARTLTPYLDAAIDAAMQGKAGRAAGAGEDSEPPHRTLMLRYLEKLLDTDRDGALEVILEAVRNGVAVTELHDYVLLPAQVELGEMWHRSEISVAEEHFGTATTQAALALLRPFHARAEPTDRRLLAASVEGDLHDMGLRLLTDRFEMAGWRVIYLGANVPRADLAETVERTEPDVVALSAGSVLQLRSLEDAISTVRGIPTGERAAILVGGPVFQAFPELARRVGADGTAASSDEAVELATRLVSGRA